MAKILIIAGYAPSLYNFRGPLIRELLKKHEVSATAPYASEQVSKRIEKLGVSYYPNDFQRTGLNPLKDRRSFQKLKKIVQSIGPDYVLAYTIKPVIYGLMAAKTSKVPHSFALITGLGSGFDNKSLFQRLIYEVVKRLYRRALRASSGIIFQNPDDQNFFIDRGIINRDFKSTVINGSGVDMGFYSAEPPGTEPMRFLLIARMVREKGVEIFVDVARKIRKIYPEAIFELLGGIDENPNSLTMGQLESWQNEGVITYHGATEDVRPFIRNCSVFVLPTYYREGTPRTILEAMAMTRPIITTDTPGCRETVEEGVNGFLVPPRDNQELYDRILYFIENPGRVVEMGKESLRIASEKYAVEKVNRSILEFMNLR